MKKITSHNSFMTINAYRSLVVHKKRSAIDKKHRRLTAIDKASSLEIHSRTRLIQHGLVMGMYDDPLAKEKQLWPDLRDQYSLNKVILQEISKAMNGSA